MNNNMVLHLGNGYIVDASKVIGIFDLENTTIGQDTRIFLKTQYGRIPS